MSVNLVPPDDSPEGKARFRVLLRRLLWEGGALAALLLALSAIYGQIVRGRVLAGGDLHLYFYPYWMAAVRAFHSEGSLLWNPHLFAGAPLLANSQVGALYPLNWPFWLLSTTILGDVARALHGSVLLHVALGALNTYVLTRAWSAIWRPFGDKPSTTVASRAGALMAGLLYAGSGFFAAHVEHLNQLQALAWLPLCLLPPNLVGSPTGDRPRRGRTPSIAIIAFAMILLAGHTQMAFIAAVGIAVWYGVEVLEAVHLLSTSQPPPHSPEGTRRSWWRRGVAGMASWAARLVPFVLAGLLAGAQLVPTLQLAALSGRGTGYAWREAVSFSLPPWQVPRAILPPYFAAPLLPEGVAYTGLLGLLLAGVGMWTVFRSRVGFAPVALALTGVFLATGGYNPVYLALVRLGVPGFSQFRAPARFMGLFVLGTAVLAGLGLTRLVRERGRLLAGFVTSAMFLAAAFELWIGGRTLPLHGATTLRAYTDLRPATAHLMTAHAEAVGDLAGHRYLSISQTLFEVGDREELLGIYGDRLPANAMWAYLVASKQREVLVPNLSLAFNVPAVDGYDGGVLPLFSYSTFSRLLLPEATPDGRLRENLTTIPERRWLDLLGVRHLLTDKTGDVWIQDVLYDRQFCPALAEGEKVRIAWLPAGFAATELRLLYAGRGEVRVELQDGRVVSAVMPESTELDTPWRIAWEGASKVIGLEVLAVEGSLRLSGASLVDERLGSFYPLVLSDAFRLVHSGDVKIYEAISPPSRAFLVSDAEIVTSTEEALSVMAVEDFDPVERVVLIEAVRRQAGAPSSATTGTRLRLEDDDVRVIDYGATHVTLDVRTGEAGYLVLTDAWYPGWTAWITVHSDAEDADSADLAGQSAYRAPILQANLLFRAVPVNPGHWRVTMSYVPRILYAGLGLSLLGCVALGAYTFVLPRYLRRLGKFDRSNRKGALS
jgi:hypothetical protein